MMRSLDAHGNGLGGSMSFGSSDYSSIIYVGALGAVLEVYHEKYWSNIPFFPHFEQTLPFTYQSDTILLREIHTIDSSKHRCHEVHGWVLIMVLLTHGFTGGVQMMLLHPIFDSVCRTSVSVIVQTMMGKTISYLRSRV